MTQIMILELQSLRTVRNNTFLTKSLDLEEKKSMTTMTAQQWQSIKCSKETSGQNYPEIWLSRNHPLTLNIDYIMLKYWANTNRILCGLSLICSSQDHSISLGTNCPSKQPSNFVIVGRGVLTPLFHEHPTILPTPSFFQILFSSSNILIIEMLWINRTHTHTPNTQRKITPKRVS